ncbi:MAG: permease [Acetanaerobacterium sp.]
MHIPIYVVTGFLDAGKTTLLNNLLSLPRTESIRRLVIQFESGEEALGADLEHCDAIRFSKRELDGGGVQLAASISTYIKDHQPQEVWVEWNGMTPLSVLMTILGDKAIKGSCRVAKVLHAADAATLEGVLGKTGGALLEQLSSCDAVVVRSLEGKGDYRRIKRLLHTLNPGVKMLKPTPSTAVYREILRDNAHPVNQFVTITMLFVGLYLFLSIFSGLSDSVLNTAVNTFIGILLQAVPFLLVGVLISSAIEVFVSTSVIERHFPKSLGAGLVFGLLAGFVLPVCDCASIPIFRSLVRKGVPLPAAVAFITAAPVINPVVMLSTYYAFGGSAAMVIVRVALGILCASLIGVRFALWPHKGAITAGGFSGMLCACGCYEDVERIKTMRGKLGLFIRHAQAEFFNVGKYLMIGALISSIFQTLSAQTLSLQGGAGLAVSLFIMMAMAFLLSLCSSSDAVVARGFSTQFPLGAVMGFLVFGPMMDIKNIILLLSGFSARFVAQLALTAFAICFVIIFAFAQFGLGGI